MNTYEMLARSNKADKLIARLDEMARELGYDRATADSVAELSAEQWGRVAVSAGFKGLSGTTINLVVERLKARERCS